MNPPPLPKKDPPPGEKKDEKGTEPRKDRPDARKTEQTGQTKGNQKSSASVGVQAAGQPTKRRESMANTPVGRQETLNSLQLNTSLEAEVKKVTTNSPVSQKASTNSQQVGVDQAEERRRRIEIMRKERETNAEKIGELLKLAYLRNMKPQEAARFLHISDKAGKSGDLFECLTTTFRLSSIWATCRGIAKTDCRQGVLVRLRA